MDIGSQLTLVSGAMSRSDGEMAWAISTPAARPRREPQHPLAGEPQELSMLMRATVEARAALEEAVVASTEAAQLAKTVAATLEEALAGMSAATTVHIPTPSPPAEPGPRADLLSPREREVLALVAEGRTNKAIAAELFVSPNTIKTHVASLLNKLRADTRVQLAVIASRRAPL